MCMRKTRAVIVWLGALVGLILVEQWVITNGGLCMPKSEAIGHDNPQPVSIEWIEASRRGWAGLSAELRDEFNAVVARER